MLTYFLTLGTTPKDSDEQIRRAYLQMVKKYPPEKDPERFQKINKAYEAIKDVRQRVRTRIFSPRMIGDYEEALLEFAGARDISRRRATLGELMETCERLRKKR